MVEARREGEIMTDRDLLSVADLTKEELEGLLSLAGTLKDEWKTFGRNAPLLAGKTLAMIFEKPSLRTRLSFEAGMAQLGGHAVYLGPEDIGLGVRESVADVARVAAGMADSIMARVFTHETVLELATYSDKPVINGLSDLEHPCQILADLLTIMEMKGKIQGLTIAFVGDGENNVTHSLALVAGLMGFHLRVASPEGYWMKPDVVKKAKRLGQGSGGTITELSDPKEAVSGADIVYADTWISMGDEAQKEQRLAVFGAYQVTSSLMKLAKHDAVFMHDLPAYRGQEVAADVIDGTHSIVFPQAENRLHAQKALLLWLMGSYVDSTLGKGLI